MVCRNPEDGQSICGLEFCAAVFGKQDCEHPGIHAKLGPPPKKLQEPRGLGKIFHLKPHRSDGFVNIRHAQPFFVSLFTFFYKTHAMHFTRPQDNHSSNRVYVIVGVVYFRIQLFGSHLLSSDILCFLRRTYISLLFVISYLLLRTFHILCSLHQFVNGF